MSMLSTKSRPQDILQAKYQHSLADCKSLSNSNILVLNDTGKGSSLGCSILKTCKEVLTDMVSSIVWIMITFGRREEVGNGIEITMRPLATVSAC